MRVVPTPQPSQSAGEMPAKSTELENASAGSFFAEIDRVLNKGEQKEIPNEKKASEQSSETNENNDLSLFLSACLFAMQPVKTEFSSLLDPSGSCSTGPENADSKSGSSLDAAFSVNGNPATPSPSGSSESPQINSDTKGKANLVERAFFALQPSDDPSALNTKNTAKNEPAMAQTLAQNGENAPENIKQSGSIFQNTSVPDIDSETAAPDEPIPIYAFGKSVTKSTADYPYRDDKVMISEEEILQKIAGENNSRIKSDTNSQVPVIQESPLAIESVSVERLMTAGKNTFPHDFNATKNESTWTDIFRNIENGGQGSSGEMDARAANGVRAASETMSDSRSDGGNGNAETMDMNGSRSDRMTGRNESPAWMAMQSKLGSPVADPVKTKASMSEHTQEKAVGMAAGFERSTGTNISATSPNAAIPSRPGELVYQIADRIQVQLRDGKNEIRIQLKPESLGSLEIRAEATSNGVVARITAESAAVKNYLENNLHILQQNLQDQGLKVERIQIAVQEVVNQQASLGQFSQFGHAASGGRQWSDTHRPAQPAGDLFSTPAEEIAVDPLTLIAAGSTNRFHTVA
jgi:flagellar hook-length control protein FliK